MNALPVCAMIALPAATSAALGDAQVFSGTGSDAQVTAALNTFRNALGPLNPNTPGSFGSGRREINWDGVPDRSADPTGLPPDFFNSNAVGRARGIVYSSPEDAFFMVSASSNNPAGTPINFASLEPQYGTLFRPFSSERLLALVNGTTSVFDFFVPGTNTPATVSGFGAVFCDVDLPNTTQILFVGIDGNVLTRVFAPPATTPNAGFSFVGVHFTAGEQVARVEIISGNVPIGPGHTEGPTSGGGFADAVVMDDFVYGEPVQAQSPFIFQNFDAPGVLHINNQGLVAGTALDANSNAHGIVGFPQGPFSSFALAHGTRTDPVRDVIGGINDSGVIVGFTQPAATGMPDHPLLVFFAGEITEIPVPADFLDSSVAGIDNSGAIAGTFTDRANGRKRGFVCDAQRRFTRFDAISTTSSTQVTAMSANGTIVGQYSDGIGSSGFVRSPSGTITLLTDPAAVDTITVAKIFYNGINDNGVIVGAFQDNANTLGFIRDVVGHSSVIPNPSSSSFNFVFAINNSGEILGEQLDDTFGMRLYFAMVRRPGDLNCDGSKDAQDIQAFVLALIDLAHYTATFPACTFGNGDFNRDDRLTAADVPGMVNCMLSGVCP